MSRKEPSFTVGIEEEYLLVDRHSGDLIEQAPPTMLPECEKLLEGQVTPEFLQSQIEVGTRVCGSIAEARDDLTHLRKTVSQVASNHGLAMIAASTHPFATAGTQHTTPKERYRALADDLQAVVRRLMISGMHVHVGLDDDDLRIDLLPQVAYFAPHLLALSTSSPFWEGLNTGLRSYRLAVWNEMPRTGLPETFASYAEYERHVNVLVNAGVIEDASKVWWDVRPSIRYPTLEMRICDICTRVEDTICIAAIYRCWLRMLYRLRMKKSTLASVQPAVDRREPVAGSPLRIRSRVDRLWPRGHGAVRRVARRDVRSHPGRCRESGLRSRGRARKNHSGAWHQRASTGRCLRQGARRAPTKKKRCGQWSTI